MSSARKVTINNVDYDFDALSNDPKSQLNNIKLTDMKLSEVKKELAMLQTARNAYAQALAAALPNN